MLDAHSCPPELNGTRAPQSPSSSLKAEYQVGLRAFEIPRAVNMPEKTAPRGFSKRVFVPGFLSGSQFNLSDIPSILDLISSRSFVHLE